MTSAALPILRSEGLAGTPVSEAELVAEFAVAHRDRLLFDHARRCWFRFRGHAWGPDTDGHATRTLQDWLLDQSARAKDFVDSSHREAWLKMVGRSQRASTIRQMLELAGHQQPLATDGAGWDRNPLLVAARNGVVDLETGRLRDGRPQDRITRQLGTEFDPGASCDRWQTFLTEVLPDFETVEFIWRALGYSLSGLTREHVMFLLYGVTRSGKSTLLRTLHAVWGALASTIGFASLTRTKDRNGSEASPDLAVLPGVRLATAIEVRDGGRFDEARIKSLTGGDSIVCRPLYGRPFEFTPQFRLWLAVNDLPRASDDAAFWSRTRVIPFRRSFLGKEDRELENRLLAELPGILSWCVQGFDAYRAVGLPPSQDMSVEANRWRDDNDALESFIASLAPSGDERVAVPDLFAKYESWATGEHLGPRERLTRIGFGRTIARRFPTSRSNGKTYVQLPVQECR